MNKVLMVISVIFASALQATSILSIDEKDLPLYWVGSSGSGTFSPAMQKLNDMQFRDLEKYGTVYITMDYTINADGSVTDVKMIKIEPSQANPKPYVMFESVFKYTPASGIQPRKTRVSAHRRPIRIPKP
jgi:hypothetical protein